MDWRRLLCSFLKKNNSNKKLILKNSMAERYFSNTMPDFVQEEEEESVAAKDGDDRLLNLLRLPYDSAAQKFLQAASTLKDEIVRETWTNSQAIVRDFSLYTGSLGTAYLCFKAYEVTENPDDLSLCTQIIESCVTAARGMREYVTFICGQAGVYALGAVAAKYSGNQQLQEHYLNLFKKIPKQLGSYDVPYELLYGRAGFLWAVAFLNKYFEVETIPSSITDHVVDDILKAGKSLSHKDCPLMYEWHGKKYWGAAHGLAGIMHVLMHFQLSKDAEKDVKETLHYMIEHRFPSGNYPSSEGSTTDRLVHWCHGAPGVALTLCKAAQVFPEDEEFKEAALDAGEVVWNRGLLRRVGICHGISGNAYVFLALYRLTGDKKHLYRAKAFTSFLLDRAHELISAGQMHGGDHPYSLFEGLAGTAHLWFDMIRPLAAKFPAYEL